MSRSTLPRLTPVEMARKTAFGPGLLHPRPGHRFCETCQQSKPRGKRKAVKGWQCDDCRSAGR